jgi:hypothetical protein
MRRDEMRVSWHAVYNKCRVPCRAINYERGWKEGATHYSCSAARATYSGCLQSTSALNAAWVEERMHDLPCGTFEVAAKRG